MFFKTYKVYLGEEGWYIYKQPDNPVCRAIRYSGPHNEETANKILENHIKIQK